jgi:F-type H+-transporting ATPase subunit alpha
MKKVAGSLKIDQAQYNELAAFTKFGGDLDPVTMMAIDKGQKNEQLLVQRVNSPMPVGHQIAVLYCGVHGLLKDISADQVQLFEKEFLNSLESRYREDVLEPLEKGEINDEITATLEKVAAETVNMVKS